MLAPEKNIEISLNLAFYNINSMRLSCTPKLIEKLEEELMLIFFNMLVIRVPIKHIYVTMFSRCHNAKTAWVETEAKPVITMR